MERKKSVVCKKCFIENSESIDLIKVVCRDKLNHHNTPKIRVYWNGTCRRLEQVEPGLPFPIRPFPPNWVDHGRRFILCHGADKCYGTECYYPHSFEELDTWNSQLASSSKIHVLYNMMRTWFGHHVMVPALSLEDQLTW